MNFKGTCDSNKKSFRRKSLDYLKKIFFCSTSHMLYSSFSSVTQYLWLFTTPWTAAHQAFLSINSQSLFKLMSIDSVMPSNHLILCHPLLLLPSTFPSIRFLSSEPVLCIRWPKYWSLGIVAMHNYHSKIVVVQGCILLPLFNLYAEYIMQNGRITSWNQHCLEKYQ